MRVIGRDGEMVGVLTRDEAIALAEESGSTWSRSSRTRIRRSAGSWTYGKFKFELQKKANAAKKKQKQVEIKELKFRPITDDGDYQIKLRNMRRFLEEGDKVKVNIRFRAARWPTRSWACEMADAHRGRPGRGSGHRAAPAPGRPRR